MKTIISILALLIISSILTLSGNCQKTVQNSFADEISGNMEKQSFKAIDVSDTISEDTINGVVINMDMIRKFREFQNAPEEFSFTDVLHGDPEEISIRYMAYQRIRLIDASDTIQKVFLAEVAKIKTEISQNNIEYKNLVYKEKDSKEPSEHPLRIPVANSNLDHNSRGERVATNYQSKTM